MDAKCHSNQHNIVIPNPNDNVLSINEKCGEQRIIFVSGSFQSCINSSTKDIAFQQQTNRTYGSSKLKNDRILSVCSVADKRANHSKNCIRDFCNFFWVFLSFSKILIFFKIAQRLFENFHHFLEKMFGIVLRLLLEITKILRRLLGFWGFFKICNISAFF